MITSLHLRNFQCHQRLDIELELVNTFVGRTGAGKSAILRALRWLAQNQPAGNGFIRDDAKFCRVRSVVDDHTITRKVGTANEYHLDDKRYVSFGRGVPTEIDSLLNVTSDNFQQQLDGPFWFSLTPGQVAKELNRIINLGVIDNCLGNLAAESRKAKATVEVTRERLREAKAARGRLAHVPALAARLKTLQDKQAVIARHNALARDLGALVANLGRGSQRLKTLATGLQWALKAEQAGKAWVTAKEGVAGLRGLIDTVEGQEIKLCRLQSKIGGIKKQLAKVKGCPLCGAPLSRS